LNGRLLALESKEKEDKNEDDDHDNEDDDTSTKGEGDVLGREGEDMEELAGDYNYVYYDDDEEYGDGVDDYDGN
jgi:hypothetical protein